jgi:protein-tyrosine phosphatase
MSLLREFPLGLPGRIYGSAMPFGYYDKEGKIIGELRQKEISVVVLLAEDEECLEKTKHDLLGIYGELGIEIIRLPIRNYGVPTKPEVEHSVSSALEYIQVGRNVLAHCSAGLGRTPFFIAFMAMKVLRLSGRNAIRWIGQVHSEALLTPQQIEMILAESASIP